MRIAVATTRGGLDDVVSPVFGRCSTFTLVDVEDGEVASHEVIQNPHAGAMGEAGIQAGVQMVSAQGNVNEKALDVAAGRLASLFRSQTATFAGRGIGADPGIGMGRGLDSGRGFGGRGMETSGWPMPTPSRLPGHLAEGLARQLESLSGQLDELSKRIRILESK